MQRWTRSCRLELGKVNAQDFSVVSVQSDDRESLNVRKKRWAGQSRARERGMITELCKFSLQEVRGDGLEVVGGAVVGGWIGP